MPPPKLGLCLARKPMDFSGAALHTSCYGCRLRRGSGSLMTTGSRRRRSEPGAHSLRKEGSTWRPRTALPATPSPAVESRAPEGGPPGHPKAQGRKAASRRQGSRRGPYRGRGWRCTASPRGSRDHESSARCSRRR